MSTCSLGTQLARSRPVSSTPLSRSFFHRKFAHGTKSLHVTRSAAPMDGSFNELPKEQVQPDKEYVPYSKMGERDPYRRLGIAKEATFDEVQQARNYLYKEYKWHEPSREAIELAYEDIMKDKFRARQKAGYTSSRSRRSNSDEEKQSLASQFDFLEPAISTTTLINEGTIFLALAFWALFSTDQTFPVVSAIAYAAYKYQTKRVKRNPEGPHFLGNPLFGAVLSTVFSVGLAVGILTLMGSPIQGLAGTAQRFGGVIIITIVGAMNIYFK